METKIIYECKSYVVVYKPAGHLSEENENSPSCPADIREYFAEKWGAVVPYTVHRLDRNTDGLMVYALTKKAAADFSKMITDGGFSKEYKALVTPADDLPESGEMRDYLYFDRKRDKSFVVGGERNGAKEAVLTYRLGETLEIKGQTVRVAYIQLKTGRTHQIRVQFASRRSPLCGDGKYGSRLNYKGVSLTSYKLSFEWGGERVEYTLD